MFLKKEATQMTMFIKEMFVVTPSVAGSDKKLIVLGDISIADCVSALST